MEITRREFVKNVASGLVIVPSLSSSRVIAKACQTKINVGIIGLGRRGRWLARVARDIPEFEIIACCDLLQEHLNKGSALINSPVSFYHDHRKLLENQNVDAVIIATPLFLHYQMCRDALAHGKHVYCEKTMVFDIPEIEKLKKQVDESELVFQVGYQNRYNPLYKEIKFLIDQGYCGKITQIYATWNRNGDWRRSLPKLTNFNIPGYPDLEHLINWRMYLAYSGGLMAELCSHQIDIVNWMLDNRPVKVMGRGGIDYWKDGRETFDNVNAVFEYPDGVTANFSSITSNALLGYSIQLLGEKGSIVIEGEQGHRAKIYVEEMEDEAPIDGVTGATRVAWGRGEGIAVKIPRPANDDYVPTVNSLKHFVEKIETKGRPYTDVDVGSDAAKAVHLANIAMREESTQYWDHHMTN